MLIQLSDETAVIADIVAWTLLGICLGYWHHRLPAARLARDGVVTRLRTFERGGRLYDDVLRIRRWKDRLPEAGAMFAGGVSKRRLLGANVPALEAFARETRRAERVHWCLLASAPLFVLWNSVWLTAVMAAYACVANLPFIAVQRYNRARIARILAILCMVTSDSRNSPCTERV